MTVATPRKAVRKNRSYFFFFPFFFAFLAFFLRLAMTTHLPSSLMCDLVVDVLSSGTTLRPNSGSIAMGMARADTDYPDFRHADRNASPERGRQRQHDARDGFGQGPSELAVENGHQVIP